MTNTGSIARLLRFVTTVPCILAIHALLWAANPAPQEGGGGTPPNGTCAGATVVDLGFDAPVTVTGSNANAPTDPVFVANVVWEGFTITACADVIVSYCGTTPPFVGGLIYLTTGCPLTNLVFGTSDDIIPNVCGDANFALRFPELPAGTYYFPVLEGPGSSGDYTLVFSATPCADPPPANAVCAGAVPLVVNEECTYLSASVEHATAAGNSVTSCGNGDVSDGVWYTFQATGTSADITVQPSIQFNVHLSLFEDGCPDPVLRACAIGNDFGTTTTLAATGLTPGATYLVRVADWYAGTARTSTFDICIVGAGIPPCEAVSGGLAPDVATQCYVGPSTMLSATPTGAAVLPPGFGTSYLLVNADTDAVLAIGPQPMFNVSAPGNYSMHALVHDPLTFDPISLAPGSVTIGLMNLLFVQGGGTICASLDLAGALFTVEDCCPADVGDLLPVEASVCLGETGTSIAAIHGVEPTVPEGYDVLYLLSSAPSGTIAAISDAPGFVVDALSAFAIHTLVIDTLTFDTATIEPGATTIAGVNAFFLGGGGSICGELDVVGATVQVVRCCPGALGVVTLDTDTACQVPAGVSVGWTSEGEVVPEGWSTLFLLSEASTGVILDTTSGSAITLQALGVYGLHQLLLDTVTLDPGSIGLGTSTIGGLADLLVQGGGDICALLDTVGARVVIRDCSPANDDCSLAQQASVQLLLECGAILVAGDNTYATQGNATAPSCGDPASTFADVWYTFNTGANTTITLLVDQGTMTHFGVAVLDACDATVELACWDQPSAAVEVVTDTYTDLLVRVYTDRSLGQGGVFGLGICGAEPIASCEGGLVSFTDGGTSAMICQNADPDILEFNTSSTSLESYTYVITDMDSIIVMAIEGPSLDFNALPVGTYLVHGVSHELGLTGTEVGLPLTGISVVNGCMASSANAIEVRVDVCSGVAAGRTGAWSIWPSPNNGRFTIQPAAGGDPLMMQVLTPDGRLVFEQRLRMEGHSPVPVELPASAGPGVYVIRLLGDAVGHWSQRIIVR